MATFHKSWPGLKNKDIYIWGGGKIGRALTEIFLLNDLKVKAIIDSNSKIQGQTYSGIQIISPNAIKRNGDMYIVICTKLYIEEIKLILESKGFEESVGFSYYSDYVDDDINYLCDDVPLSKTVGHLKWQKHLYEIGNKPGVRVLEVGSREVTGKSKARENFSNATYIGFDYYPGDNVDIVGDAHKLSSYFDGEKFDIIYSHAVFEHFAMPWVVAREMSKLLKVGGFVFVETHFSFSSHERPWHFFQFSDMALKALFSPAMGFECIEAGMSNPMVGRFSSLADEYLRNKPIFGLYCHSDYFGRKIREVEHFEWDNVDLTELVEDTRYPKPKSAI